jgi:hypothetical protein
LTANQIAAEDEKKIDSNPTESIHPTGQFEPEKRGVVNDNHNDGERAEKIETRLAFAIGKARVNFELTMVNLRPDWRCTTHEYSSPILAKSFYQLFAAVAENAVTAGV